MPINPMQFVTQVRPSRAPSGLELGKFIADQRSDAARQKTSSGYLALQTRQQDFSEQKYGQAELDKALARLDDARLMGNADEVSAAEDQLRLIAQRNGYGISASVSTGPATERASVSKDELPATPGDAEASKADVLDADSPEFKAAAAAELAGKPPTEVESNARINAELSKQKGLEPDAAAFEADLIAGSGQLPERTEQGGQTTDAMKMLLAKQFGQVPLPKNLGDFRSPGQPTESLSAGPQAGGFTMPGRIPPPRPLSSLTITDAKGRELYRATGDAKSVAERQRLRAQSVFAELSKKAGDDTERQLIAQAGDTASGLIGTMPLEKAVKVGLDMYQDAMQRKNALSVVEANRKPRGGGGGGGGGLLGKTQDIAESIRVYSQPTATRAQKIVNESDQYANMESGLMSGDPALQRNAINELYKIRAGTAVSAAEDARVGGIVSALDKMQNKVRQWTGGPISPEMLNAMLEITRMKQRINRDRVQTMFDQAADEWEAQNEGKIKDPEVFKRRAGTIRKGARSVAAEAPAEAKKPDEEDPAAGFY